MLEKFASFLLRSARDRGDGKTSRFLAFLDYAYMPYALGDTITWIENAQVSARDKGIDEIDVVVLASRERPAPSWQPAITAYNFAERLYGVLPVIFSSLMVRNVHLLENRQTFYAMVMDMHDRGVATWPHIEALTSERMDFISHLRIVDHYRRSGSMPLLGAPRGYERQSDRFKRTFCADRFCVVVNVRQSQLRAERSHPDRDSRFETWAEFISKTAKEYRDVVFIIVGQYSEVDRRFERLPATVVPRSHGFGLGTELALLQGADLFMGTSSGFAQAALFGQPAYIVTHTEPRAAVYCGVPEGARRHPFGRPDQIITWTLETPETLQSDFREILAIKASGGARTPTQFA